MSILYWLLKFSQEALIIELFLISLLTASYLGYLLFKKRRYGVAKNNIPDNVVRAFLVEILSNAEGFKNQLFGEHLKINAKTLTSEMTTEPQLAVSAPATVLTSAGADPAELAALKKEVQTASAKQAELAKTISQLSSDKATLEQKLAAAAKGAESGGALTEAQEKIAKLQALLAEYEVIEDDLANLKKYQQENKALKEKIAAMGGALPAEAVAAAPTAAPATQATAPESAPVATTPEPASAPAAAAPEPEAPPAPAPAPASAMSALDALTTPTPAEPEPTPTPAAAPAAAASTPTSPPAPVAEAPSGASAFDSAFADTPQTPAEPVGAAAAAAPAPAAGDNKSDADLLQEFEKMLNG